VVARIHPVGLHGAQVLNLELDERAGQLGLVAEVVGEGVGLELEAAGEDVHEELDDRIHGREDVGEEDEADNDGVLGQETKVGVEGVVVDEDGEEGEDVKEVDLSRAAIKT